MTIEYKDSKRIVGLSTESLLTSSDYTSGNFTTVGSTVTVTNNSIVFSSTPSNSDNGQYKQITALEESDVWSIDFKVNQSSGNTYDCFFLFLSATSGVPNATGNNFIKIQTQGTGYMRWVLTKRVSGTNTSSNASNNSYSYNTDYYGTLSSDGTNITLKIWTSSARSGSPSVTLTVAVSGVGTMNYIQHRSRNSGDSNTWSGTVSEVALSRTPAKPTDVQENSLLVEKDTARRYWFSITPVNGYDVANISSDSKSSSGSSQSTLMLGLGFNADGTKAYRVGYSVRSIFQYSLSTAWDISTASYDSVSFSLPSPIAVPYGIEWNGDGTKFVVCDSSTGDLYQFSLSTAYDISTTNSTPTTYDPSETTSPDAIKFNSDGTKAFVIGQGNDTVYRYSLSTAYDISTMSYDSNSFTYPSGYYGTGLEFNSDGTEMYLQDHVGNSLRRYTLSTAYDLSTASLTSSFSTSSQFSSQTTSSLTFSTDGTKLYIGGYGASDQQYSTGTAEARTWTRQLYFADDFSSYTTQTSANSAWVPASNVAGRRVNISDDDLDLLNDSGTTNYAVAYDLGTDISESKWTLRFSADVTLSSGSNNWCYIGLFNSDQSAGGGDSQNLCAVAFQNDGSNTKFWCLAGVGKTVNGAGSDYFNATGNGTLTSTKYYIQLRRLTATSMDMKIYTDANYSTLHDSRTMSGSAIALDDLRYIKFANNTTSGSGSITIVMDDVKFRNGADTI